MANEVKQLKNISCNERMYSDFKKNCKAFSFRRKPTSEAVVDD